MSPSLFSQPLNVINVGIAMFSDDLKKAACRSDPTRLDTAGAGQYAGGAGAGQHCRFPAGGQNRRR
ncbi:putative cytoplasmic protein [Escherichia coli]|uniref:Putative cytoplasmic protein n=1 Tax=Escherichia coli TaxID=562 RepID=A0A376MSW3_ECOLX|nr:putative cytoplasmic protein [Escherichia coli]